MVNVFRSKFTHYLQKLNAYSEAAGHPYRIFGIFFIITYPAYHLLWVYFHSVGYDSLLLRMVGVILCVPLALKDFWPKKLKVFLALYFYLVFIYGLPFLFTFFALKNNFSSVAVFNSLSIFVLCVLILDFYSLLITVFLGVLFGILFFYLTSMPVRFPLNYNLTVIMYISMFVNCIIFSPTKEYIQKNKVNTMRLIGEIIAHELKTPLRSISLAANNIKGFLPDLLDSYKKAKEAKLNIPEIDTSSFEMILPIFNTIDLEVRAAFAFINLTWINLSHLEVRSGALEKLSMMACLEKALMRYPLSEKEHDYIELDHGMDFSFMGDEELIIHLFFNLLRNGVYYAKYADQPKIRIWLSREKGANIVHFRDNGKGISKEDLSRIFDQFFTRTFHGMGVGLTFCKSVMESFGGQISCESREKAYTEFLLRLPVID